MLSKGTLNLLVQRKFSVPDYNAAYRYLYFKRVVCVRWTSKKVSYGTHLNHLRDWMKTVPSFI